LANWLMTTEPTTIAMTMIDDDNYNNNYNNSDIDDASRLV